MKTAIVKRKASPSDNFELEWAWDIVIDNNIESSHDCRSVAHLRLMNILYES